MDLGNLALSLPVPPDVRTCIDWAQRAEALDYESVWISEVAGPDPFVLAAAIAQATSRVRIGIADCRERIASYVAEGVNTSAIGPLSSDPDAIRSVIEGLAPG
jgi:hypothetical protein